MPKIFPQCLYVYVDSDGMEKWFVSMRSFSECMDGDPSRLVAKYALLGMAKDDGSGVIEKQLNPIIRIAVGFLKRYGVHVRFY